MKTSTRIFAFLIIMAIFLGACNLPSNDLDAQGASLTAAAQTVEAQLLTLTPQGQISITPSFTTVPAQLVTLTPPSTLTPPATSTQTCDKADFVDENYPDNTVVAPGTVFTKIWKFKNIGPCTWTPSYTIAFVSGDSMSGPASQALDGNYNTGSIPELKVTLTAPATPGTYKGNWALRNASGVQFANFWVQIKVQNPATATNTLPPAVAQIVLNAVSSESGTVYEPAAGQGIPSTILAGDTSSNHLARGYMSFDISTLSGKVIQSASLSLSCSQAQDPFASLSGIWVGELQYPLPLDQSDYDIGGTGVQLLNSMPAGSINVKSYVQSRVTEGKARFQIRLHPAGPSDADGQADYMSCNANSVTLTIVYQP